MDYDPLADILEVAADCCDLTGQISKALTVRRLREVLIAEPELGRELARRIAKRLEGDLSLSVH
jgi:hypothetical protein